MAFLDFLTGYWMGRQGDQALDRDERRRRASAHWGLDEGELAPPAADAVEYDKVQWRRKLKRVLEGLPDTRAEWEPMMTEAHALGFDEAWLMEAQVNEFTLLVRRAVADCEFTHEEHVKLDTARDLIGLPAPEAEALVKVVVAEAEAFFGKPVADEP